VFDVARAGAEARDMLKEKILNVNEMRLCAEAIAQGSVDNVSKRRQRVLRDCN
jgi:hypothetical protein